MDLTTIEDIFGTPCKVGDKIAVSGGRNFSDSYKTTIEEIVKHGRSKKAKCKGKYSFLNLTTVSRFIKVFDQ